MSDMYWRMGFGWVSISIFAIFTLGGLFLEGTLRWFCFIFSLLIFIFMIMRYRHWNGSPWRKVHFRAMLVYAAFSGEEAARSQNEGREYEVLTPCRQLAYRLVGHGKQDEADEMVDYLLEEKGAYFSYLVAHFLKKVHPEMTTYQKVKLIEVTNSFKFCPQLVIGNVIENTYGGEEALRYVIYLLKKEAA